MRIARLAVLCCFTLLASLVSAVAASAQTAPPPRASVLYVGVGTSVSTELGSSQATPWSVGYLYQIPTSRVFIGADLSGEGTAYNNTSNRYNEVEQGLALNVLVGGAVPLGKGSRFGLGALVGGRQTGKSCADSYLGYQCYADQAPEVSYDVNMGGVAYLALGRLVLGGRVTTESRQATFGFTF